MPKVQTCYFALTHGLQGCYMPDMHFGAYAITRRKDLIEAVRDALDMMEAPKSAIRQINWTRLWDNAKRYGTSCVHFSIETGKHTCLSFHGLTEAEYNEMQERDCE
jgi:hypothetical protein